MYSSPRTAQPGKSPAGSSSKTARGRGNGHDTRATSKDAPGEEHALSRQTLPGERPAPTNDAESVYPPHGEGASATQTGDSTAEPVQTSEHDGALHGHKGGHPPSPADGAPACEAGHTTPAHATVPAPQANAAAHNADQADVQLPVAGTSGAPLARSPQHGLSHLSVPHEPKFRRLLRQYHKDIFPVGQRPFLVAASVFVGAFIGVLPTLGVALPLTWLATAALRLPKGPAMVASFVATPPTLFFFFYPVGYFAVGLPLLKPPAIDFDFLSAIGDLSLSNLGEAGSQLWLSARGHVMAFLAGMTLVALVTALICGWLAFLVMERRQRKTPPTC